MNDYTFDLPPIFTGFEDDYTSATRHSMFGSPRRTEPTSQVVEESIKEEPYEEKDVFVNYGAFRTRSSTPEEFYYEEICERKHCYDDTYHECEEDRIIDGFFDAIAKRLDRRSKYSHPKLSNMNYVRMSVCRCIYQMTYTSIQCSYCSAVNTQQLRNLVEGVMRSSRHPCRVGRNINLLIPIFKEKFGEEYDDEKVISYCKKNHEGLKKYLV